MIERAVGMQRRQQKWKRIVAVVYASSSRVWQAEAMVKYLNGSVLRKMLGGDKRGSRV